MIERAPLPASVTQWLSMLESQRRLALRTRENYRHAMAQLIAILETGIDDARLQAITPVEVRRAAATLHGGGQSPRTVSLALAAWRNYFRWLARQGIVAANPVDGLRGPKSGKPLPKALSPDLANQLMTLDVDPTDPVACRDAAVVELLYSSGLRLAEIIGLDLRPDGASLGWLADGLGEVTVTGKGSKRRIVPVGRQAADALRRWLAVRALLARDDASGAVPLFVGVRGHRVPASAIQLALRAQARAQGLGAKVHPHMLRHSFASHVLQSSGDLRAVQDMLGHASISTTQIYTRLDYQHLAKAYDSAHPRARKRS
ncbi:tyrosine recombinase XerC [soil metagenome]